MQCPFCGSDSAVTETRDSAEGVRRRRVCAACKRRFTTYEKVGSPGLRVEKRDGSHEPFDGDKLFRTLERVADFFRQTEPHSPLAYALNQAVRWGRMPLPDLLTELIPDEAARTSFFRITGIQPPAGGG